MKTEAVIVTCDSCGTEGGNPDEFRHITVSTIDTIAKGKNKGKPRKEQHVDLCLKCLGQPGILISMGGGK